MEATRAAGGPRALRISGSCANSLSSSYLKSSDSQNFCLSCPCLTGSSQKWCGRSGFGFALSSKFPMLNSSAATLWCQNRSHRSSQPRLRARIPYPPPRPQRRHLPPVPPQDSVPSPALHPAGCPAPKRSSCACKRASAASRLSPPFRGRVPDSWYCSWQRKFNSGEDVPERGRKAITVGAAKSWAVVCLIRVSLCPSEPMNFAAASTAIHPTVRVLKVLRAPRTTASWSRPCRRHRRHESWRARPRPRPHSSQPRLGPRGWAARGRAG